MAALLPFRSPPRSGEVGGESWLLATVNRAMWPWGLKGGFWAVGCHQSHHTSHPTPNWAVPSHPLGTRLGLSEPTQERCSTAAHQPRGALNPKTAPAMNHRFTFPSQPEVFCHSSRCSQEHCKSTCLQSYFLLAPVTSPLLSPQESLDIEKYFKITKSLEKKHPSTPVLHLQRSFHGEKNHTVWEHFQPLPGLGEEEMLCASSATCHGEK